MTDEPTLFDEPEPEPAPERPALRLTDPRPPAGYRTLDEARDWLRDRIDDGTTCPLCAQHAKVYRRTITAPMALALIAIYRKAPIGTWVDVPALAATMRTGSKRPTGGDEAKTRYWGLLEAMPDAKRDDGSTRTGWWRLTGRGADFVRGDLLVPKHARIYDGRLLGLDDSAGVIGIRDALGSRFDYDELMDMTGAPALGQRSEGVL